MKSFVSALGMATAAFAVATSAGAADLPSRKAAPVEYVRVCTAYGAGFFYIPGTDTCLRVSGRVRAEYTVGSRYGDTMDAYGTRARGRLNIDARTATAYGTLRTFFRYELTNSSGLYSGTISGNQGIVAPGQARNGIDGAGTSSNVDLAFVQFGPITAGRAQSFFDFYADDVTFSTLRTADSRINLLAYTATFGSGFSATVSLEDRNTGTTPRENAVVTAVGAVPTAFGVGALGQDYPDLVASLRVDQGWGSAQLSGAIAQRNIGGTGPFGVATKDEVGFAIQGGVKINLPMLAAGDKLWLQAAYADGALGYLGWPNNTGATRQFGSGRILSATNGLILGDYNVDAFGNTHSSTGWSLVAVLQHFWTPTLRTEVFGSYSELNLNYTAPAAYLPAGVVARPLDPKELIAGANLIWSPVSGLDIGVEVVYTRTELKQAVLAADNTGARPSLAAGGRAVSSDDAWTGRLRIQRDF